MWGLILTLFFLLYGIICYYIGKRGWYLLGRPTPLKKVLYLLILSLFVLPFPVSEVFEDLLPASIAPWLTVWGGFSLVGLLYGFLLLLMIDLLRMIDQRLPFVPARIKEHQKTPLAIGIGLILIVLTAVGYGGWNARHPVVTPYQLSVEKDAASLEQLKIAMVSDIHYGPVIDVERVKRLAEMVNQLQADIVLLAGDITDGSLPPGEADRLAAGLERIQAPYGVYAVPGNHDRDLRDDESQLMTSLEDAGIQVLKDEATLIHDRFYLIGRDDPDRNRQPARAELKDLTSDLERSKPLILLDHQPIDLKQAQAQGVDLQLSGHTHRGQIFPANLITDSIYEEDWGLLQEGDYHLIVSSGYGTWGPPLRIGNHPEVVLATITFN